MLVTAIVFFVVLSILVFIHELGHFTVAKLIGVRVEEFGFGLPPRIWGKTFRGTIYSINWLPIGGFVKLAGEDEEEIIHQRAKIKNPKQYFWARSKKERSAILLAGVTMNFLLSVVITALLLTRGVYEVSGRVHVESVSKGSPAQTVGLQKGDIILSAGLFVIPQENISYTNIKKPSDLISFTNDHKGKEIVMAIDRAGDTFSVTITPRVDVPKGEGPLGVSISDLELHMYPPSVAPWQAVKINLIRARDMFTGIGTLVGRIVQLKPIGDDVAGPIGIAQVTGQAVKFGAKAVLEFMSILSLNLAVINILPFPALDGGRLLFVFIEKFLGKKVRPAFERSTHQVGMLLLLLLVALISINDIIKLARGG